MRNNFLRLSSLLLLSSIGLQASAQTNSKPGPVVFGKSPIKDVIKAMTLEEKSKIGGGYGL